MFNGRQINKVGAVSSYGNSASLSAKRYMDAAKKIKNQRTTPTYDKSVLTRMISEYSTRGWDSSDFAYIQMLMRERGLL